MNTVATINFKGGVGKTTATWALGNVASLAPDVRSLILDLDAQMSLTQAIALNEDGSPFKNFSDWYDRAQRKKRRYSTPSKNLRVSETSISGSTTTSYIKSRIDITSSRPLKIYTGRN